MQPQRYLLHDVLHGVHTMLPAVLPAVLPVMRTSMSAHTSGDFFYGTRALTPPMSLLAVHDPDQTIPESPIAERDPVVGQLNYGRYHTYI